MRPAPAEHRRLVALLLGAGLAFLGPAFGIIKTALTMPQAARWVEETRVALVQLDALDRTIGRVENWQHDFLILGAPSAQEGFRRAAQDVEPALARAVQAAASDPEDAAAFQRVQPILADWLHKTGLLVSAKSARRVRDLPALLDSERAATKAVHETLDDVKRRERSLLMTRLSDWRRQGAVIIVLTVLGAAISLALLSWGGLLSVRDLDRRIALDEMHQEVAHHVNHELRGPATSVAMAFSLLKTGPKLDSEQTDIVDLGLGAAEHLKRMVDDLLDVTRLETGKMKVEPRPLEAGPILEQAVATLRPQADARGVALSCAAPGSLPVLADPIRLRQVVCNLLDNAVKFTPHGGKVELSARKKGREVTITVSDTGPGIAPEDLERIFDRLYQSQRTAKQSAKGLGLGLAVCRELVARQGGRIWAESEPGRGARLRFTVPAV